MLIVDAQIHLWNAGNPTNATHRQVPAYLKDDALKEMDAGGVDAAVLTPHTPWDPNANELAIEAARQHPDRFAILGNFPLDKPESRALVDTWKQRPGMLGLRFTFPPAAAEQVADRRDHRLAVAGGGARRPAHRADGGELPPEGRRGRSAASEPQADPRSSRPPSGVTSPSRAVGESPGGAGAREVSQRRHEGHRRAELLRSSPTRSATSTTSSGSSTTPSAPRAGSGAPTSRACPARGASA